MSDINMGSATSDVSAHEPQHSMPNRLIHQVYPTTREEAEDVPAYFSDYEEHPNLVLLGDPGFGKTQLFKSAAQASGGRYLHVRRFLIETPNWADQTLFIDALDEKRAGRGDDSVIDAVVARLIQYPPKKVRISCRERDWLGDTDREAFAPFFEHRGDVVVLRLGKLTRREQHDLLQSKEVSDPDTFLQEAMRRDAGDLVCSPQSLIMLVDVVKDGHWPATRLRLFELYSEKLLREHNSERARRDGYSPTDLRGPAGAICAMRLVADVDGVSIDAQSSDNTNYPSFSTLSHFFEREKLAATLSRPLFESAVDGGTVDYVHRTTAEFLAAEWIALQVRNGLPIERVEALIGVSGHPAAELRGLHSWLPVLLPEWASRFIAADPHGVLCYGDAVSLQADARILLFNALAKLSETDPWFRSNVAGTEKLAALCVPEMAMLFDTVLTAAAPNRGLRALVLEILQEGPGIPSLREPLFKILCDANEPTIERLLALYSLCELGAAGEEAVVKACKNHLAWSEPDIQLRAGAYGKLYGRPFSSADVAELVVHLGRSGDSVQSSTELWSLPAAVPSDDSMTRHRLRASTMLGSICAQFLVNLLSSDADVTASNLWKWLIATDSYEGSGFFKSDLIKALHHRRDTFLDAVDIQLSEAKDAGDVLLLAQLISRTFNELVDEQAFLARVMAHLRIASAAESVVALFEGAMTLVFAIGSTERALFEELATFGQRADLEAVRGRLFACSLTDWRYKNALRKVEEARGSAASRERQRRQFEEHSNAISSGKDLGWLAFLANIYFCHYSDLDRQLHPHARLLDFLGEKSGRIALDGFVAILSARPMPTPKEIAEADATGSFSTWWYAIVAGLDEQFRRNGDVSGIGASALSAGLAIVTVRPATQSRGNTVTHVEHLWAAELTRSHRQLVIDVFFAVIDADLKAKRSYVNALSELRSRPMLLHIRSHVAIDILRAHPDVSGQQLRQLLECAAAERGNLEELCTLARQKIGGDHSDRETFRQWLACATFLSPDGFIDEFVAHLRLDPALLWVLRDFQLAEGVDETWSKRQIPLSVQHLEALTVAVAAHFPSASYPVGGYSGNTNPWDGSEYLGSLVSRLSAIPSREAADSIGRLCMHPDLVTYRDFIKHAAHNQQARRREAEYEQPSWAQTLSSLANQSPANAADLHALIVHTLLDVAKTVSHANNDVYKRFWNEDRYGRPTDPKPEESCRHVLIDLLRVRLAPLKVSIDPEGHMAGGKRADMIATFDGKYRIPIELKRNYHSDVWTAPMEQLDELYTGDPQAYGFGIYGVFWFGNAQGRQTPVSPLSGSRPGTAMAMKSDLDAGLPTDRRDRLAVVMFDVAR